MNPPNGKFSLISTHVVATPAVPGSGSNSNTLVVPKNATHFILRDPTTPERTTTTVYFMWNANNRFACVPLNKIVAIDFNKLNGWSGFIGTYISAGLGSVVDTKWNHVSFYKYELS